jgi:HlyD family secretion protein
VVAALVLGTTSVCGVLRATRAGAGDAAQPPAPATSDSPETVHALARLEPVSGLVTIGARPGARIETIAVRPHDVVREGTLLAVLEGHAQAQAQLALAVTQKAKAEHARDVKRQQLALEREQFDKLHAARIASSGRVFGARQRWAEIAALYKQLLDDKNLPARDRFDVMIKDFEAERENLRGEQEIKSFEIAQQLIPRQRKLEDAELEGKGPDQELLDHQIELARAGLALAEVRAQMSGEVLELLAHEGEVSSGALLLFGDTSAIVATAEVFQSDVPRVRVGDAATAQVLDRSVPGKVTAVGSVVGRYLLTSMDPRALQDRRVVKVTIRLDDPALARRLIGMEVDVAIRASGPPASDASGQGTGR